MRKVVNARIRESIANISGVKDNRRMSTSHDQLFEGALSLPQPDRADLAFQLLQSLMPPGDEVSREEFAAKLYERIEAHRRGELQSMNLHDARAVIEQRLLQERPS